MDTLINTSLIIALGIVILAAVVAAWQRWQGATPEERNVMVQQAVIRLVDAAEQLHPVAGAGQTKYGWVMNRLQKRFPDLDWDIAAEYIEAAVLELNRRKGATLYQHRNGSTDRNA